MLIPFHNNNLVTDRVYPTRLFEIDKCLDHPPFLRRHYSFSPAINFFSFRLPWRTPPFSSEVMHQKKWHNPLISIGGNPHVNSQQKLQYRKCSYLLLCLLSRYISLNLSLLFPLKPQPARSAWKLLSYAKKRFCRQKGQEILNKGFKSAMNNSGK